VSAARKTTRCTIARACRHRRAKLPPPSAGPATRSDIHCALLRHLFCDARYSTYLPPRPRAGRTLSCYTYLKNAAEYSANDPLCTCRGGYGEAHVIFCHCRWSDKYPFPSSFSCFLTGMIESRNGNFGKPQICPLRPDKY
jgi:hypothetical protein